MASPKSHVLLGPAFGNPPGMISSIPQTNTVTSHGFNRFNHGVSFRVARWISISTIHGNSSLLKHVDLLLTTSTCIEPSKTGVGRHELSALPGEPCLRVP